MLSTEELKNYVYNEIQMRLGEVSCGNLFFAEGTDNSVEGTYIFNKNNEYHILFTEKGKIRSDIVTDKKREVRKRESCQSLLQFLKQIGDLSVVLFFGCSGCRRL